mmetsp:Transcript_36482/g.58750  ORF Transcript_36482/g.58750 Transcript_36482/m.58750 type:complete len:367 (-) Transcript_36482:84-1184(-)
MNLKIISLVIACLVSTLACEGSKAVALTSEPDVEVALNNSLGELSALIESLKKFGDIFSYNSQLEDDLDGILSSSGAFLSVGGDLAKNSLRTLTRNLDEYYSVNLSVHKTVYIIKTSSEDVRDYLSLIDDANVIDANMYDFIDSLEILTEGVSGASVEVTNAESRLEYIYTNMSQLDIDFQLLAKSFTEESLKESDKLYEIHADLRRKVYLSCIATAVLLFLNIFLVPACYATAAGVVEGVFTKALEEELNVVNKTFSSLSNTMTSLGDISTDVRESVKVRRENLSIFAVELESARLFLAKRVDLTKMDKIVRQKRIILMKLDRLEQACEELLVIFRKGIERKEQQRRRLAYAIHREEEQQQRLLA